MPEAEGHDIVTGDAVHERAAAARRALRAAQRRSPPPADRPALVPAPDPAPDRTDAATAPDPPVPDPRLRALVTENEALRAENAALREALAMIGDVSGTALER